MKGRIQNNDSSLQKQMLNISAGGAFYERAKSRRTRHRDVLKKADSYRAMALGRGGARGPGLAIDYTSNTEPEYIPKKVFQIKNKEAVARALRQRKVDEMQKHEFYNLHTQKHRKDSPEYVKKVVRIQNKEAVVISPRQQKLAQMQKNDSSNFKPKTNQKTTSSMLSQNKTANRASFQKRENQMKCMEDRIPLRRSINNIIGDGSMDNPIII